MTREKRCSVFFISSLNRINDIRLLSVESKGCQLYDTFCISRLQHSCLPRNQHQIVSHYRQPSPTDNPIEITFDSSRASCQPTLDTRIAHSRKTILSKSHEGKVIPPVDSRGYLSTATINISNTRFRCRHFFTFFFFPSPLRFLEKEMRIVARSVQ